MPNTSTNVFFYTRLFPPLSQLFLFLSLCQGDNEETYVNDKDLYFRFSIENNITLIPA